MLEGRSQLSETSCLMYKLKETDTYVMAIALIQRQSYFTQLYGVFCIKLCQSNIILLSLTYKKPLRAGLISAIIVTEP